MSIREYIKGDMVLVNFYGKEILCIINEIDHSNEYPYRVMCFPSYYDRCKKEDIIKLVKE